MNDDLYSNRGVRGGCYYYYYGGLKNDWRGDREWNFGDPGIGFRVASLPEPSADFDEDGDVDGADFLYWQLNDGSESNLAFWESQFGTALAQSATTTVPEPATLLLMMFGLTSVCCHRRRR